MVRVGGRPTDYTEPLPTADRMDGLQVTILHEAPVSAPPPRLTGIFRIRNLPAWARKTSSVKRSALFLAARSSCAPDGIRPTIPMCCPFHLKGGRGRSLDEIGREYELALLTHADALFHFFHIHGAFLACGHLLPSGRWTSSVTAAPPQGSSGRSRRS